MSAFLGAVNELNLGQLPADERDDFRQLVGGVSAEARQRWARVQSKLQQYHDQFARFLNHGDGGALSSFLNAAPELFVEMGDDISRLQHVCASWRFWQGDRKAKELPVAEARALLLDYDSVLGFEEARKAA